MLQRPLLSALDTTAVSGQCTGLLLLLLLLPPPPPPPAAEIADLHDSTELQTGAHTKLRWEQFQAPQRCACRCCRLWLAACGWRGCSPNSAVQDRTLRTTG